MKYHVTCINENICSIKEKRYLSWALITKWPRLNEVEHKREKKNLMHSTTSTF